MGGTAEPRWHSESIARGKEEDKATVKRKTETTWHRPRTHVPWGGRARRRRRRARETGTNAKGWAVRRRRILTLCVLLLLLLLVVYEAWQRRRTERFFDEYVRVRP